MRAFPRKRWLLTIPVSLVALIGVNAAAAPTAVPICEKARAWVSAHKDVLPTTLPELSAFPIAYRRAIYSELPTETRKQLWHDHLSTYLTPSSELTPDQQAIVRDVIGRLDAFVTSDAAGDSLRPRLIAAFGKPLARRVFATLGPEPIPDPDAMAWTDAGFVPNTDPSSAGMLDGAIDRIGLGAAPMPGTCECEQGDNWCWTVYCGKPTAGCEPVEDGCGTGWSGACNGECNNNI